MLQPFLPWPRRLVTEIPRMSRLIVPTRQPTGEDYSQQIRLTPPPHFFTWVVVQT